MTLTQEQFVNLCDAYTNVYIDDIKNPQDKEEILFDMLSCSFQERTQEQVIFEIRECFGEEVLSQLLESVTV
jgi:hypothetical protein